jgi:hypothetical protein
MISKMTVIKIVKFISVVTVCVGGIYLLNPVVFELSSGLIVTARHLLPLKGLTAITCMYLVSFISIGIVAFVSGFFHSVTFNMIRSAIIIYITWDWFIGMKHFLFIWELTGCSSLLPLTIKTISNALLLVLALISLKTLHTGGRKLWGKIHEIRDNHLN